MRRLLALTVLSAACGSSPTAPTRPPVVPPTPTTVTITGHVSATNGGQPLAGVSAALGATSTTTDGSGSFTTSMLPQAALSLALTGNSIVPRTIRIAATSSRDVTADAIVLGGGFDLNFYRQLVRNQNESATMQPLRRWTTAPSIYVQTSTLVDARTLDMVAAVARDAVPTWTSGAFSAATVERGGDTRENQAGWITIQFGAETQHCGLSDVAKSGGVVMLYPKRTACACGGFSIAPGIVRHEFGHAMGFYHTDGANDVMIATTLATCDAQPSARERYHAAVAYARPMGNLDPDTDPAGVVNLTPVRVQ